MTTPGKMEKTKSNQTSLQEQLNNELKENEQLRLQFSTAVKQTRELNEFIQIMLTISPFGTCIIEEGKVIFANKAFSEAFGMTPGQIRKLSPWEIIYEQDHDLVKRHIEAILDGRPTTFFVFRIVVGGEKIKWILGSFALFHMNEKQAIMGNFVDLTEGWVIQLAFTDPLTGLSNRKIMMDRLEQAIIAAKRRSEQVAVLFLDLDDFKKVNDTYGHKTGDQLLIEIAGKLREVVRRENDTIARFGGDEFFILLTNLSQGNQVETVIGHLFEAFAQPLSTGEPPLSIKVNLSVGVALYPLHGTDPDTLIRNADSAMYQAKKMEKNCYCFYDPGKITADEVKNLPAGPDTTCG